MGKATACPSIKRTGVDGHVVPPLPILRLKEVQPHVPDAWIDASKKDDKDQQIGLVGDEIPFNRHFYQYQPPRDLVDIDADLDKVSAEIMELLREVHS